MKKILLSFSLFIFLLLSADAQEVSYQKERISGIKKLASINLSSMEDPFQVNLINLEAPAVSGNNYKNYLSTLKQEIAEAYPKNDQVTIETRGDADPPVVLADFAGSPSSTSSGVPLDNHLATSNGQVISAMNSYITVFDPAGVKIAGHSLAFYANELGLSGQLFDPRLHYDTESDRFVMIFLHGSESIETNIIIGFSDSNDASADWYMYSLPGNPNNNTTWTDYPMMNITKTDLIMTGNLIRDNESWQIGFDETVLWQIDKNKGYAGEDLESMLWQGITYGGQNIRNLCPAESGDEILEPNCYFLSNRNFSVENDSIFVVELTGGINDPATELLIDVAISDVPYGVPPNAEQQIGDLQTNDARILEAFYQDNEIQFVGNTRNLGNNKAGIYHGHLYDVDGARDVTLEHIIGDDYEIGYPGITYTGMDVGELDAILNFNHTSATRFAGISAMYYLPAEGYSDIITIKEGTGYISIIGGVERWGDYSGSQRDFSNGEICWTAGFYGAPNKGNFPWVVQMARPQAVVDVDNTTIEDVSAQIFPNPVAERFSIAFDIPRDTKMLHIDILDQQGRLMSQLFANGVHKTGSSEFSFDVSSLQSGYYVVRVRSNEALVTTKPLIIK